MDNYRGNTLLSCLSKLLTSVLNGHIEKFCEKNNSISDAQFGFRKGQSTVDAMFALQSIVHVYLNHNQRLYIAFIDLKKCFVLKKCFDSIYRNGMWLKLFKTGIQSKMLRIVKNMFAKVKSCFNSSNTFSDFFEYSVGLRHGEVISPILVSSILEDLELCLQNYINSGILIGNIAIILFADDTVILEKQQKSYKIN